MIISFLIAIIGIIPMMLAIAVFKLYKGSELAFALFLYMAFISFWQLDVAVLYLKGVIPKDLVLFLFRFFRMGPTFIVPIVFYLTYILIKKHTVNVKNQRVFRIFLSVFNLKVLYFLVIWSFVIYLINMTKFGIYNLHEAKILGTNFYYYFPEYGPLQILYLIHVGSFMIFAVISYIISKQIQSLYLKEFLGTFSWCTIFLFVTGFMNFIPGTGALLSSLGIIIFSVIIIFSFVKMHTMMTVNYNRLMEHQRKLDETGNLTGSLVHEVKNNLQIIKGYSKLLSELPALPAEGKRMNEMIQTSSEQLDELIQNYTKYIKHKSIEFKMVDLNEVIAHTIEILEEKFREKSIEVSFEKKYRTLKTYANQTYLNQVFVNILKNSCEAFSEDSFNRKITISADIQADRIFIHIDDTGKGIPPENWESIFNPFISSKKEGMGLGLPFVRKIIYEHRGDIKVVESSPEGTHMQIILPQYSFSDL